MPIINPNTLFHFTSKIEGLKGILSKGLRMSYCYEECTQKLGIALPMVCFCDIPLLRTLNHRAVYGNYMVGLDKEFLINQCQPFLNPVNYLNSLFMRNLGDEFFKTLLEVINHSFSNEINRVLSEKGCMPLVDKYGLEKVLHADDDLNYKSNQISFAACRLRYSLAFSKEYSIEKDGKKIINYDEREWRYILNYWDDEGKKESWLSPISLQEFKSKREELNSELWSMPNSYITIQPQNIVKAIKFIVVKNESQISSIIRHIRKSKQLFGNSGISDEQKDMLISRILSFDIIEQNF